jgi:hypothetical protein
MRVRLAVLALVTLAAGCGKKEEPVTLAPLASSLTVSSAGSTAPGAGVLRFAIDPKSTSHVEMPGQIERIVADTTAAAGTLDVVPSDLGRTRGLVRVDLTTLTTSTFHTGKDADQTRHARTWLEAVVDGKVSETNRWADFAIRSVDGLSATDLSKVPAVKDGDDDVRKVSAVVHGDLLVHGHQVTKDDAVEVTFRYAGGAGPDAKPSRVEIRSTQPMPVVLREHDVQPRDPVGKLLGWTAQLLSKVSENADVTVNIAAVPAP